MMHHSKKSRSASQICESWRDWDKVEESIEIRDAARRLAALIFERIGENLSIARERMHLKLKAAAFGRL